MYSKYRGVLKRGTNKRLFHHLAGRTKKINIKPSLKRGGERLG